MQMADYRLFNFTYDDDYTPTGKMSRIQPAPAELKMLDSTTGEYKTMTLTPSGEWIYLEKSLKNGKYYEKQNYKAKL